MVMKSFGEWINNRIEKNQVVFGPPRQQIVPANASTASLSSICSGVQVECCSLGAAEFQCYAVASTHILE